MEFRDGVVWRSLDSEVQALCGHLGELKCFWDTNIPGSKTDSNLCLLRVCGISWSPSLSQRTEESRERPWKVSAFLEDLPQSHETWQWDFRQVWEIFWGAEKHYIVSKIKLIWKSLFYETLLLLIFLTFKKTMTKIRYLLIFNSPTLKWCFILNNTGQIAIVY